MYAVYTTLFSTAYNIRRTFQCIYTLDIWIGGYVNAYLDAPIYAPIDAYIRIRIRVRECIYILPIPPILICITSRLVEVLIFLRKSPEYSENISYTFIFQLIWYLILININKLIAMYILAYIYCNQ